jgi:hypothetical protein
VSQSAARRNELLLLTDSVADHVYCGPGYDTVDQMPRVVDDTHDAIQYEVSELDVIADDCEVRAL